MMKRLTVAVFLLLLGPIAADAAPPGLELVQALRSGGYVVYIRHAMTERDQADTDRTNFERCDTQRNLSAEGRQMAREIGRAFDALGIPVGKVITSPYCRTVETGQLAFRRHDKSDALYFAVGASKDERTRQSVELRRMLGTAPPAKLNTVLVSHHANLKEATGIWPKAEGDAHVFRPRAGGEFDHVAEVTVADWSRLAREFSEGRGRAASQKPSPATER